MKTALAVLLLATSLSPCCVMAVEGVATGNAATESTPAARTIPEKDPKVAAAAITKALRDSREINASKISVTTHASVVVIGGSVASEAEAARARSIAEKTADGVRVTSNIEVQLPPEAAAGSASAQVVRDVQAALRQDARTSKLQVTVNIDEHQTIELNGLVPSAADRAAAQAVAAQVKGVSRVQNGLVTSSR